MFCPKCGRINPDEEEFCKGCGALLHEEKEEAPKKSNFPKKILVGAIVLLIAVALIVIKKVLF